MKKYIVPVLISGLVIVAMYFVLDNRYARENYMRALNVHQQFDQLYKKVVLHTRNPMPFTLPASVVFTNESSEKVSLGSLVGREKKIFLKTSQYNCSSCIESEVKLIKKLSKMTREVILITQYNSINEAIIFKNNRGLNNKVFNVEQGVIGSLEKFNQPYYFSIDTSLRVGSTFLPDPNMPELTKHYLINN